MNNIFHKYIGLIKDYVFPVYCLGCECEGTWLCVKCFSKIDLSGVLCCPVCHLETVGGVCCTGCAHKSILKSQIAITTYTEESLIGKLITALKYQYAEDVKVVFESLIEEFIKRQSNIFSKIDLIVAVPLHKKRFVERGYNQAEIIADILTKKINIPMAKILIRDRATRQQAKLKREERLKNLQDAFCLVGSMDIKDKKILLVDDVYTTGSTIGECAKILKDAGAFEVAGFTVARG